MRHSSRLRKLESQINPVAIHKPTVHVLLSNRSEYLDCGPGGASCTLRIDGDRYESFDDWEADEEAQDAFVEAYSCVHGPGVIPMIFLPEVLDAAEWERELVEQQRAVMADVRRGADADSH